MNRHNFLLFITANRKLRKQKIYIFLIVPHHVIILLIVIYILIFLEKANHIYVCNHAVLQSLIHRIRDK